MSGPELQAWLQNEALPDEAAASACLGGASQTSLGLQVFGLRQALAQAEGQAGLLARAERLGRLGSFQWQWPSGQVQLSAGLQALLGLDPLNPAPQTIEALAWVPPEEQALVGHRWRGALPGERFEFQHHVVCADGRRLRVLHQGMLTAGQGPDALGVALLQDITTQHAATRRLLDLTSQDEVTGLPNRASLLEQIDAALQAAPAGPGCLALMVLDVPRIAEIRASMGIGAGDTLAMSLAARLREVGGGCDVVARLGDTEYAWLFATAPADDTESVRQRVLVMQALLQAPVRLGATDVFPLCRIGVGRFPTDGDNPLGLLEAAQAARLEASAGGTPGFFRPETIARALREMRIEAALRRALDTHEFELQYQPKVDLTQGGVVGAEALLRWHPAELGTVSPTEFIPIAEVAGLIGAIDEWVMRRVCEQAAKWRQAGLPVLRIGVNLSPLQLQRPDLAHYLESLLIETGIEPDWVGVELAESLLMDDVERTATALRGLRAIGIEISLGDFGTGFSNLHRLSRLPIDVVKIDRSLVHDVMAATEQVSVTRAIIDMAHGLQMKVLAEGVETEGQLGLLAHHGCDQMQGFCFSPPLAPDDFAALLAEKRRLPDQVLNRSRRSHTLLLVDDEQNILAALKRLLRRDGYQIITATSAAEALQRLVEHEVDVILSDQRMPGMTGVEFLHRAKALYPHTVRMVLSGYTELQSIIDAVNEGAIYKFLTKPWDDERLRAHVAEAFRQKDLADENRRLSLQVETTNADLARLNERLEHLLTQQRDHTDLLATSAESTRGILDELPAAVLGVDPDGLVVYANTLAEAAFSGAEGLLGRALGDVLPAYTPATDVATDLACNGQRFQVRSSAFEVGTGSRGHLLVLWPQPVGFDV
jgi:diguanylate cyclase (GGDEF)-like protein